MGKLPVSVYFTAEWWDRHYHSTTPRPQQKCQQGLEDMYLGRLRFLFEEFGRFGLGDQNATLGPGQIATVIRYQFDLVPVLLGTRVELKHAWGTYPKLRSLKDLASLQPVDIAQHAEGEWLVREKQRLQSLYGGCTQCVDIGSVTNNAFRMVGEEAYAALLSDVAAVRNLFEAVLATEQYLYSFLSEHFRLIDPVPVSNCNVPFMGPRIYETVVLPFDARQARFAQARAGLEPRAAVHHCDVRADSFAAVYAKLPGLASLEASFETDIQPLREKIPGCAFFALVSPPQMLAEPVAFEQKLRRAIADGADALQFWNIDPAVGPARLRQIWAVVETACEEHDRSAEFSGMPLCWEEIEWCHAMYADI